MDNYEFNQLSTIDKVTYTRDYGLDLMVRTEKGCSISLYRLDNFFVEIWWHHGYFAPYDIRSFKSIKDLEPYLDDIWINERLL